MASVPIVETERLRLRAHRVADFDAYAAMWADPKVYRYVGGHAFTREQSWSRFLRQSGHWQQLGFGFWAIEEKATGAFGGECGFQNLKRAIEPSLDGTLEAGWGLTAPLQGRGLAEEAMRGALAWAAGAVSTERLTCIIHPDNAPSLRLAGKLGFAEIGRPDYLGSTMVLLGRPRITAV